MKSSVSYDVIIIGAGPAGISAAIYLKRAGINFVMFEKEVPGGVLNKTTKIENYPGYLEDSGTTLAFRMYNQIESLNIDLKMENVVQIVQDDNFKVITDKSEYKSKYLIISTGKIPKKLDAINSDKYENRGISYCTICDGALYKNKNVAIFGGGNSAVESAEYMSNIASTVYVINRSSKLRATEDTSDIISKNNVKIIYNSKIKEILGSDNKVVGIKLDNGKIIDVSAVFVCIGQETNPAYYQKLKLNSDKLGIIVDSNMQTNNKFVYACGDAISKSLYQVVTATSEGAVAATSIIKKIRNN